MQLFIVAFLSFIIFLSFNSLIEAKDVKVFKRGKVSLIDETQFKFPYEYEFTDDQDATDFDNAYDEKVPFLPRYILHKNGFDQGYTRVPIVTRKGENTWSTPRPTTQRGEEYKTWGTPKILPITKPTPSHPEIARTTPVPKTTFIAKFSAPQTKAEKPAKKPEVKATTSASNEEPVVTKLKKFFTRRPTTTSSTESTTEASVVPSRKQFFTRRPTTSSSTETSKEVTKSKERKLTTSSSSVETITEDFTTVFTRKSFKKPKTTTTASSEETSAATKKQKFTRKPLTTSTSVSSEDPSTSTSRKQFTRRPRPTSTETASTESSTEASTRRKFTRRPTSTESTTESTTEASTTRRKFTRKPKPTSTEKASTESSTEASTTRRKFTRRPTTSTEALSTESSTEASTTKRKFTRRPTTSTSASSEQQSSEATTTKKKFTRKPKPTPTTTTEEPTTTTMLPLKDRLRPILTTREPTPTMPRRFRVFTNPSPAEPPSEVLNPQQEIENQRKLKEKFSFGFNQEFSSKQKKENQSKQKSWKLESNNFSAKKRFVDAEFASAAVLPASSFYHLSQKSPKDIPIDLNSKDTKLANYHFSKFAQRFGVRKILPSTPQRSFEVVPITASPVAVANFNNGHGVEQTVRSNPIVLQSQNPSDGSSSSTAAPEGGNHRWSSSWSSWSSWDANGREITGSTKTFTTFDTPESTTPTPTRTRQFTRTRTNPSTLSSSSSTSTRTSPSSSSRAPLKPPVIHHGKHRYRGPTYNCRVLTPIEDGRPSINNDPTCKLKYPGFPADDSCRCRYDVEARDEHGCATGFLYTCKQVFQRT